MLRRRGWGRGEGRRDCARWFVLRVRVACVVVSEWGRAGAPASSIRRRRFQSVVGGASKTGRRHAPSGSRTHDRERCPPTATDARPARRPTADGDWGLRAPMCRERHQQCRGDRGSRGQLSIMSVSCAQTTGPAHCSRSAGERRDTDERTASEVPCWRRAADGLRCVPVDRPLRRPGPGSVPPRRLPNCRGTPFARSSVGSSSFRVPGSRKLGSRGLLPRPSLMLRRRRPLSARECARTGPGSGDTPGMWLHLAPRSPPRKVVPRCR